jgi:ketosteroid isomerase-like protein
VESKEASMSEQPMEIAKRGFMAWREGDLEAVESIMHPNVQWRWYEPGEWDCHSRDDVMQVVRERYDQGFAQADIEFVDAAPDVVIVVAHPRELAGDEWPEETATVLTFRDGKVVDMQDHRTKEEALEAVR